MQPVKSDPGARRQLDRRKAGDETLGPRTPNAEPDPGPLCPGRSGVTETSVTPVRRHSTLSRATASRPSAGAGGGPKRSTHSERTSSTSS